MVVPVPSYGCNNAPRRVHINKSSIELKFSLISTPSHCSMTSEALCGVSRVEHAMNYSNHAPMHYANEALSEAGVVALRSGHPIGGSVKRAFDIIAALLCIMVSAPLLFGCCLLVLAHSPGPILYRQRRIGFGGREFTCLKFRTMATDSGAEATGVSRGEL